ncbi:MAG: RNA polymerase factor sigma-54 [Deltaproteobacteria bacterium]|nr:RNA polymerase factor sigma-54 [Deltaproteobacteria bacterium]
MALELKISQKLSQSLVMTPQLQQAIKLLQLGRQEYLDVIENELLENPALEDGRDGMREDFDEQSFREAEEITQITGADSAVSEVERVAQGRDAGEGEVSNDLLADFEDKLNEQWTNYFGPSDEESSHWSSISPRSSVDDELPSLEAMVSKPEGLEGHLLWQLRVADMDERDKEVAVQIIGNLDKDGYLASSLAEIAEITGRREDEVESVLFVVQELDPVGVAARDLRDCLLIQLREQGLQETMVYCIVDKHLGKLEAHHYEAIAKEEQIELEEVGQALKIIQSLEPRPGRSFITETPVYITPDIYIRKVGDDYVLSLNENDLPKLRLNPQYRELLEQAKNTKNPEEKEYLQDKIKSALWLIKSVHQRQQTIYKVTESIMKFQRNFLDLGVKGLKPLVLKDVAEDVKMHESTVSRVTTNKYAHTPQGIYELKFFFSSGIRSESGDVSSETVKERIRVLVEKEDSKKPLSDQAIVNILRGEGVDIARRTVAKYREMMNILSSSRRKQIF